MESIKHSYAPESSDALSEGHKQSTLGYENKSGLGKMGVIEQRHGATTLIDWSSTLIERDILEAWTEMRSLHERRMDGATCGTHY